MSKTVASRLLAKAVKNLFPNVRLLGGEATATGFFYDFAFPVQDEMFPHIEETMRQDRSSVRFLEMAPISAAALLEKHGDPHRALQARQSADSVVSLIQIGDFADLCEHGSTSLGVVKLLQSFKFDNKVRVFGLAHSTRDELKAAVRSWKPIVPHFERLGDWLTQEGTWLPKGVRLQKQLCTLWEIEMRKQNFEFVITHARTQAEMACKHGLTGLPRTAEIAVFEQTRGEGLYQTSAVFLDQFYVRGGQPKENFISSLHFILEFLKIFSFDSEVISRSKRLTEVHIRDAFGRLWPGPYVERAGETIVGSLLGPMERFVALLLESERVETLSSRWKEIENQ